MQRFLRSNSLLLEIPSGGFQRTNCSVDVVFSPTPYTAFQWSELFFLISKQIYNWNLFLMHFNVRSIQKNVDKLLAFLSELNVVHNASEISETNLKPNQLTINIDMQGYIFVRKDSSKNSGE